MSCIKRKLIYILVVMIEWCMILIIYKYVYIHGNWSTILKIEGVQRRFTRMIDEVGLLPYSERLGVLKLTTLIERRTRGDLIEERSIKY